jgi:hypothetical protein
MIERQDFWRLETRPSWKEWQHVALFADGLDLLVNFSVSGGAGRAIVMARAGAWHGFVETAPLSVSADGTRSQLGRHRFSLERGRYRVRIERPELHVDLTLRPLTLPMIARNQLVGPGTRLSWAMYPRLAADGECEIDGRSFTLRNATAYHDHNWGGFRWGDDFAWEWGVLLPDEAACPYALVHSRLWNRARTRLDMDQLFLYRGEINVLAASGSAVETRLAGRFGDGPALRLPPPMALLHPRRDADLPAALEVAAHNGADRAQLCFRPESTAQLLLPAEADPFGVLVINECVGRAHVEGMLDGASFSWEGRGVYEFVRG